MGANDYSMVKKFNCFGSKFSAYGLLDTMYVLALYESVLI